MTVKDYLKVLNGIKSDEEFIPDAIRMVGFVDIAPSIGDIPCKAAFNVDLFIEGDVITAKRAFDTEYGEIKL